MKLSVEELQSKWIDVCIEKGYTFDAFSLSNALPLIYDGDQHIVLSNQTLELQLLNPSHVQEVYVTEQELKRLWSERSLSLLSKSISQFNIADALLLIDDEEDMSLLEDPSQNPTESSLPRKVGRSSDIEEAEVYITESVILSLSSRLSIDVLLKELRRLWEEREGVKWGLPSEGFDIHSALLLADTEDEDDSTEYVSAAMLHALSEVKNE